MIQSKRLTYDEINICLLYLRSSVSRMLGIISSAFNCGGPGRFDAGVWIARRVKGKAISIHAWAGSEGFRRLRLPDFKTVGTRRW